ncbi:MAG: protein-disulfide reductase DsbD family protein, partial [Azospirillaceae bacterium]
MRKAGDATRVAALAMLVLAALLAGLAPSGAARAETGPWRSAVLDAESRVEARLIAAVDGVGTLEEIPAGLQVRLPDGWKTYWRSPGEAGLPPRLDWSAADNLASAELAYPAPHRFTLFGLDTFGYAEEVVFPIAARPAAPGEPMRLAARVDLLICADLCVPATFDLRLALPDGPATGDPAAANLIDRYASRVPQDPAASGLAIEGVAAAPSGDALIVEARARDGFTDPDVLVEAGDFWMFGAPEPLAADGGPADVLRARLPVLQTPTDAPALAGQTVTLTLVDGVRAVETTTTIAPAGEDGTAVAGAGAGGGGTGLSTGGTVSGSAAGGGGGPGLAAILGLALLGGLILNLMPCVLPVLSIKLMAALGHAGGAPGRVRAGFLASSAGILVSFLALAGGAIAFKAAGGAVGWGIQFQQPLFLVFMIVVLTLFACNLAGLFEIALPGGLGDAAGRAGGKGGLAGDFATGAFATLLATPCSAPFLGTAVAFALARGPAEILAVFLALGLGLAAPYLAVAGFPGLARRLPRPGPWMVHLRRVLALALVATAVWLASVLAAQIPIEAALIVAGLMVALAGALALRRLGGSVRRVGAPAAAVLALA